MIVACARWYLLACAWLGVPIAALMFLIPVIGRWLRRK